MVRPKSLPSPLDRSPFTTGEALARGVTRGRLRAADLAHPYRGVHSTQPPADLFSSCIALRTKLPPYAFFCGATAAVLLGVPLPLALEASRVVHVGVPAPHRTLVGRGIRGHTYQLVETRKHRGLQLSSPRRLWCELAVVLKHHDLVAAADYLTFWDSPMTTIDELVAAVDANPSLRGRRQLRRALPLIDSHSESPRETKLRLILMEAGIDGWVANVWVTTADGYRYRADLAFPRRKLIIEYQSELHNGDEAFRADMTRRSRLEADDWFIMFVNENDLQGPGELTNRVQRVLAKRPLFG